MVPNHARYQLRYTPILYSLPHLHDSPYIINTAEWIVKKKLDIRLSPKKYNVSKGLHKMGLTAREGVV